MRIFLHDYCGHPFQIQLSRWLASQGHSVCHAYSRDIESPRGNLTGDGEFLTVAALGFGRPVPKYDLVRRSLHEWRYAAQVAACARAFAPDIILSGNSPPAIQEALLKVAHRRGGAFIYWLQDIFSAVLDRVLASRLPIGGPLVSAQFRRYEFGVMARSDAVVAISGDFVARCVAGGVPRGKIHVQHNWAPLTEIAPMPRANAWSDANGLTGKFVFLFSGTLGLKHNPGLLSRLAESLRDRNNAVVAVISQGMGRDWLEGEKKRKGLANLRLADFQPFDRMASVLASADVLLAILEPFAGELSVPSKILTYLCAERPLLAALPPENLASRIVHEAGAGRVVSPLKEDEFILAARALLDDPAACRACAGAGRAYALEHFDIDRIGGRFLDVFQQVAKRAAAPSRARKSKKPCR